jgi:hypothetical protein
MTTICIILQDDKYNDSIVKMNKHVRENLRVRLADLVTPMEDDVPCTKRILVLPLDDMIE